MQGDLEVGAQLVDDPGQGAGLGGQSVRRELGGRPLRLLGAGRAVEAQVVVQQAARLGRDVQAGPVGVGAQQQVPGDAVAQRRFGEHPFREREQGRAAGGLVGVGAGDDQDGPPRVSHGQQVQRTARPRHTHLPE